VVVCWRLDRLGRNLKHLITLLEEFQALGIAFVSLNEGIDATTPAGKLQMHILGAIAEFERGRIQERVKAGLARVRAQGKRLGRPRTSRPEIDVTVREAAALWLFSSDRSPPTERRQDSAGETNPLEIMIAFAAILLIRKIRIAR
jgi:DNA invertase Pin-like site-specific DNA recombinase